GGAGAGEAVERAAEVEAEGGRAAVAAQRQVDQLRDRRRAERQNPAADLGGVGLGVGARPRGGALAGAGRTQILVDLDRALRERPEAAVERIDGVDAQVEPLVAAADQR